MQFDSYRWQDHVQSRHSRSVDLALTGVFVAGLLASAALQFGDSHGFAPAAEPFTVQAALAQAPDGCDA